MIADVAFSVGVCFAPFLSGLPEKSDIKQVGFAGVELARLCLRYGFWDQGVFNRVGVDAVVNLRESALEVPL